MESRIDYAVQGIKALLSQNLRSLDVRPEAQTRYNKAIQKRLSKTNWNSGCKSWYLTEEGFNATMYPGFATQFVRQMKRFNMRDSLGVRAGGTAPSDGKRVGVWPVPAATAVGRDHVIVDRLAEGGLEYIYSTVEQCVVAIGPEWGGLGMCEIQYARRW